MKKFSILLGYVLFYFLFQGIKKQYFLYISSCIICDKLKKAKWFLFFNIDNDLNWNITILILELSKFNLDLDFFIKSKIITKQDLMLFIIILKKTKIKIN